MKTAAFNWQIWVGFLLSVFAMLSYPFIFIEWPLTRDFPWVNLLLFAVAVILLAAGMRRAFGTGRSWLSKIGSSVLAGLGVLVLAAFIMVTLVSSKWLPAAAGAPRIGQKAPEFTLTDSTGKKVSLGELLTTPIKPGSLAPKGVLLIFYRGYW